MRNVILASSSQQRSNIFGRANIPFRVETSDYQEDMSIPLPPSKLVQYLAEGKALEVGARHKDAVVIGADTIIVQGNNVFGKPQTRERAREILKKLSGKTHSILTGFAILDTASGKRVKKTVETTVKFKKISARQIDAYLASGEALNKAGAYAIQGEGKKFVQKIEGSEDNARGLPLK